MTDPPAPTPDHARVRQLFLAACDLVPTERAAFLESASAGDAILRQEVESLLAHDDATGDLFSEARVGADNPFDPEADAGQPAPDRIGTFRILRRIGAGGMGEVFEAQQDSPSRRVALKALYPGAVSRSSLRRFQQESETQARLNHHAIAAVYESGIDTSQGRPRPWFAMELVEGDSLVAYCERRGLSTPERLALVAKVCDAVHHAHQRGVIHRDLKPDNILVVNTPDGPAPKVLDFGIARLESAANAANTLNTRPGQLIGTLAFMSPEQVSGRAEDIDTRTDIYALGLIMYRVLAGRSAHNLESLSLPNAARTIADVDPPRLASTLPDFRGDIDTIVHKAIARDKTHRYPSASELAADIRRHLADEPITARPTTAWQSVRRFTRRNRAIVAVGLLAVLTLIAGVIAVVVQANKAANEAAIARAVSNTLKDAFLIAAPATARGKDPTLREALDLTTQRLEEPFDGPPEAEATVRNVIAIVQRNFGEFDKARPQFERALEIRRRVFPPGSEAIADSLHNLALLYSMSGKPVEAIPLMKEALEIQRKTLGPDHPDVARSLFNLSRATLRAGQMAEALTLTNESLTLHRRIAADNHEAIGMHLTQLASIESSRAEHEPAESHAAQSVKLLREHLPPNAPPLATALNELARVRLAANNAAAADEPSQEALDIARTLFASNPEHPLLKAVEATRAKVTEALATTADKPRTN